MSEHGRPTTVLFGAFAAIVVVSLVASTPGQTRASESASDVAALLERVEDLADRVELLEYAVGSYAEELEAREGAGGEVALEFDRPSNLSESISGRYMRVDGLSVAENTDDHSEEIARLRADVRSLEQTVTSEERALASIQGSGTAGRGAEDRRRRSQAQQRVVSNYKRTLSQRRAELARYEKSQNAQKQILQGNREGRVITLHSEYDLSTDLTDVDVDDFVTWNGRRVEMDQESEVWVVRSVRKIEDAGD